MNKASIRYSQNEYAIYCFRVEMAANAKQEDLVDVHLRYRYMNTCRTDAFGKKRMSFDELNITSLSKLT